MRIPHALNYPVGFGCLPTFAIEKATIHVGKYAMDPMDPMGMTVMTVKGIVNSKNMPFSL